MKLRGTGKFRIIALADGRGACPKSFPKGSPNRWFPFKLRTIQGESK